MSMPSGFNRESGLFKLLLRAAGPEASGSDEERAISRVMTVAFAQHGLDLSLMFGLGWVAAVLVFDPTSGLLGVCLAGWAMVALTGYLAARRTGFLAAGVQWDLRERGLSIPVVVAVYDLLVPFRALRALLAILALFLWLFGFVFTWSARGGVVALAVAVLLFASWRQLARFAAGTAKAAFEDGLRAPTAAKGRVHDALDQRLGLAESVPGLGAPRRLNRGHVLFTTFVLILVTWTVSHPTPMLWAYTGSVAGVWLIWLSSRARRPARVQLRTCQVPRSPILSRLLARHGFLNFGLDGGWIAFGAAAGPLDKSIGLQLLWMAPVVAATSLVVVPETLRAVKLMVANQVKIVVFRRFLGEYSESHRQVILPVLGAYGRVVVLNDRYLEKASPGPLGGTGEVLSEVRDQPRLDDEEWADHVRRELRDADLAVFHWPVEPTAPMRLELTLAIEALPEDRLIWITEPPGEPMVRAWIQKESGIARPNWVSLGERPTIGPLNRDFYRIVKSLRRAPRPELEEVLVGDPGDDGAAPPHGTNR